mmetsp:Transcript_24742/g.46192  ORF Transcript_24742/g.46192 Transcript_24742/m.46192 type:complete len:85 (+) Transcript_24742:264-518(+)
MKRKQKKSREKEKQYKYRATERYRNPCHSVYKRIQHMIHYIQPDLLPSQQEQQRKRTWNMWKEMFFGNYLTSYRFEQESAKRIV